nr:FAD-dependent oxidoreductase [Millisia brevis]
MRPSRTTLLATGATPRELDIPGVDRTHKLRTRADEEKLKATFEPGARLVTIGGGWIALEVAASAREAGLDVTVLERSKLPLVSVLGPELAEHLKKLHESHGVDIRTETEATGVTDDGVLVGDELVPAEVILLAAGVTPSTELAAAAGLGVQDGIIADPQLRTTDPNIWVAGDAAYATNTVLGPLRVEHWDNAIRQGKLAARSILGQEGAYDWQPYFYTDQFEFSMEYVGHSSPDDSVVIRGDLDKNAFIAYWIAPDGHTITAGMNVGIWDVNDQLRELIGTTVDPEQLTVLG